MSLQVMGLAQAMGACENTNANLANAFEIPFVRNDSARRMCSPRAGDCSRVFAVMASGFRDLGAPHPWEVGEESAGEACMSDGLEDGGEDAQPENLFG